MNKHRPAKLTDGYSIHPLNGDLMDDIVINIQYRKYHEIHIHKKLFKQKVCTLTLISRLTG